MSDHDGHELDQAEHFQTADRHHAEDELELLGRSPSRAPVQNAIRQRQQQKTPGHGVTWGFNGAAFGIRTRDLRITSALLWPTELRRHRWGDKCSLGRERSSAAAPSLQGLGGCPEPGFVRVRRRSRTRRDRPRRYHAGRGSLRCSAVCSGSHVCPASVRHRDPGLGGCSRVGATGAFCPWAYAIARGPGRAAGRAGRWGVSTFCRSGAACPPGGSG